MKPSKAIKAVLFDFDGTLTTAGAIDFALIKKIIGCPQGFTILEFIDSLASKEAAAAAWGVLEEHELAAALDARPRSGAESLLRALAERMMPMGILTRNSKSSVVTALRAFRNVSPEMFGTILAREDVKNYKPHPEGVLSAAKHLAVDPGNILVVGDYIFDIQAGQAAGALTAFICDEVTVLHPRPPADFTISSLDELKPILLD